MGGEFAAGLRADQYIANLRRSRGIAIDQDCLRAGAAKVHTIFDSYSIAHSLEVYSGTHINAVAGRFQNHVMPFFTRNLCTSSGCSSHRGPNGQLARCASRMI